MGSCGRRVEKGQLAACVPGAPALDESLQTYGLLSRETSLNGRQVGDDVLVDDPGPLRPDPVHEELDSVAGMLEERAFLVGSVFAHASSQRTVARPEGEVRDGLVRLEVDRVRVKRGEEAQVDLDGDLLVDRDGFAVRGVDPVSVALAVRERAEKWRD